MRMALPPIKRDIVGASLADLPRIALPSTWVNSVGCLGRPIRAFQGNRPFGGCARPLPALSFAASTQSMGWSRTRPYPNDTEEERRMPEKLMLVLSLTVVLVGIFGAVAVAEGELIQCKKSVPC